jgi:hypothetical protein
VFAVECDASHRSGASEASRVVPNNYASTEGIRCSILFFLWLLLPDFLQQCARLVPILSLQRHLITPRRLRPQSSSPEATPVSAERGKDAPVALAGGPGFEPRMPGSEPGVLPLNYPPKERGRAQ